MLESRFFVGDVHGGPRQGIGWSNKDRVPEHVWIHKLWWKNEDLPDPGGELLRSDVDASDIGPGRLINTDAIQDGGGLVTVPGTVGRFGSGPFCLSLRAMSWGSCPVIHGEVE